MSVCVCARTLTRGRTWCLYMLAYGKKKIKLALNSEKTCRSLVVHPALFIYSGSRTKRNRIFPLRYHFQRLDPSEDISNFTFSLLWLKLWIPAPESLTQFSLRFLSRKTEVYTFDKSWSKFCFLIGFKISSSGDWIVFKVFWFFWTHLYFPLCVLVIALDFSAIYNWTSISQPKAVCRFSPSKRVEPITSATWAFLICSISYTLSVFICILHMKHRTRNHTFFQRQRNMHAPYFIKYISGFANH